MGGVLGMTQMHRTGSERREKGLRFTRGVMAGFQLSRDLVALCVHGMMITWNKVSPDMLGDPFLHGRRFSEFVSRDFREVVDSLMMHEMIETDPIQVQLHRGDGKTIEAELIIRPVRELGPGHTVVTARDISHEGRLARWALASEDRFRQLVDHSMNLICRCRGDRVEYINQSGMDMLAYGEDKRRGGWAVTDLFTPDYAALFAEAPEILLEERDILPVQLQRADGQQVHAQVKVTVISGEGNNADFMIEARDIGAQNRAVAALRDMNEQLERKVEERTEQLSVAAAIRQELIAKLQEEKAAMDREIKAAQEMQFDLLPRIAKLAPSLERHNLAIHAHFEPSSGIGGDLWGCHELDQNRLLIFVFDFAGHGVRAALNTFRLHTLIAEYLAQAVDPAQMMVNLNGTLKGLLPRGQYATMFAGVIDTANRTLTWAGAGSPKPLLVSPDGQSQWLETRGRPLGLTSHFDYETRSIDFPPGTSLFMYSDAMTETLEIDGEMFGDHRLRPLVEQAVRDGGEEGFQRMLSTFRASTDVVEDDLTAVLVRCLVKD